MKHVCNFPYVVMCLFMLPVTAAGEETRSVSPSWAPLGEPGAEILIRIN